jgi:hypothetical protein
MPNGDLVLVEAGRIAPGWRSFGRDASPDTLASNCATGQAAAPLPCLTRALGRPGELRRREGRDGRGASLQRKRMEGENEFGGGCDVLQVWRMEGTAGNLEGCLQDIAAVRFGCNILHI